MFKKCQFAMLKVVYHMQRIIEQTVALLNAELACCYKLTSASFPLYIYIYMCVCVCVLLGSAVFHVSNTIYVYTLYSVSLGNKYMHVCVCVVYYY